MISDGCSLPLSDRDIMYVRGKGENDKSMNDKSENDENVKGKNDENT